ncbi:MAG: protein translocase subunit SecF [Actinomycetota bacterium]|nr:protein translocase subunit SecF [Actinomycetota bacterium]
MRETLHRLYQGETKIDFIGRRRVWFIISAVVVIGCLAALFTRGLNYGIEFEGGVQITAEIPADGPLGDAGELQVIEEVRSALQAATASDAQVQVVTEDGRRSVAVQTKEIADPEAQQEVVDTVSEAVGASPEQVDSQRIGSKWGAEVTDKAVQALVVFLVVILAFISWRFEWKMAIASIVALVHDLIITAGVYSLVGFEVTPSSVIAILTILGYSLYDTVVVFDKVEENTDQLAATGRMTYQDSANLALNQVFMRSLNTSLATLLPIAALLFVGAGLLGAETLKDLALALLVGILTGAYSSIFVATPVLSVWKEREPKFRSVRERVERGLQRAATRTALPAADGVADAAAEKVPAAVASSPSAAPRSPTRPRAGSKKAKRRKRR